MNKENQTIIRALNMYGRVPQTYELLNEIERLNNIINKAIHLITHSDITDYRVFDEELLNILKGEDNECIN